jgi:hypothetical protein
MNANSMDATTMSETTTTSSERQRKPVQPQQQQQQHHYRLRRTNDKDDGEDDPDWNGNSQGATNCEDCLYSPDVLFEGNYPVEYSCDELIDQEKEPTSNLTFQFDYEATLPIDMDAEENVQALEWILLEAAAKRSGLTPKCNSDKQYEEDDDNDRRLEEGDESTSSSQRRLDSSLAYPVVIFSIERNPSDTSEGKKHDEKRSDCKRRTWTHLTQKFSSC